jgi:uncharacterized protein (TIGR02246 family)
MTLYAATGLSALAAVLVAAAGPSAGCIAPPGDTLRRIIEADNERDLRAAVSEYAPDVVWLPPGRAPVVGADAVRDSYEKMYANYSPALSLSIDETMADGDLAVVRGTTVGALTPPTGEPLRVHDQYLAVLRCESGNWLVARMIWAPSGS